MLIGEFTIILKLTTHANLQYVRLCTYQGQGRMLLLAGTLDQGRKTNSVDFLLKGSHTRKLGFLRLTNVQYGKFLFSTINFNRLV